MGLATANAPVDDAVARAGYYGRDEANQRGRVRRAGPIEERIENGQVLCGSPDSILDQARRVKAETGAGTLDLVFTGDRDQTLRQIELFGTQVLPRLKDL